MLQFILTTFGILLLFALLIYFIIIFNGLISLKNNIRKSWGNIDVLLKQRSDEIPNVISAVKGYMKHERELITYVTQARTKMLQASSVSQKASINNEITRSLKSIFALAENYPNLRANENFLQLQKRLTTLENEIADRREFYNDSVTNYNIRIESFPDMIVAKLLRYKREELFKATAEEKQVVRLHF